MLFFCLVGLHFCWGIEKQKTFRLGKVFLVAPTVGIEPTTNRLTADCSTAELSRNNILEAGTGIEPISKDLQSSA